MVRLTRSLAAWGTPAFGDVLKTELKDLGAAHLPLQAGLADSSYALEELLEVMITHAADTGDVLRVTAGIFYAGVIAGCSCADDPTPVESQAEYCEVELRIDKTNAETAIQLIAR